MKTKTINLSSDEAYYIESFEYERKSRITQLVTLLNYGYSINDKRFCKIRREYVKYTCALRCAIYECISAAEIEFSHVRSYKFNMTTGIIEIQMKGAR